MTKVNIAVIVPGMVAPFRFSDIENLVFDVNSKGEEMVNFMFKPVSGIWSQVKLTCIGYILEHDDRPEEEIIQEQGMGKMLNEKVIVN